MDTRFHTLKIWKRCRVDRQFRLIAYQALALFQRHHISRALETEIYELGTTDSM